MNVCRISDERKSDIPQEGVWFAPDRTYPKHKEHWRINLGSMTINLYIEDGTKRMWLVDAAPFAKKRPIGVLRSCEDAKIAALVTVGGLLQQHVDMMDGTF